MAKLSHSRPFAFIRVHSPAISLCASLRVFRGCLRFPELQHQLRGAYGGATVGVDDALSVLDEVFASRGIG